MRRIQKLASACFVSGLLLTSYGAGSEAKSPQLVEDAYKVAKATIDVQRPQDKEMDVGSSQKRAEVQNYTEEVSTFEQLVDVLERELGDFNRVIQIPYDANWTNADVKAALHEVYARNTYIAGIRAGGTYIADGRYVRVKMSYLHTVEQEKVVTERVQQIVASVTRPDMTDVEKVKALHDYVVTHTIYASEGLQTSQYTPYTILAEGKGVCQAYALLTYRLLQEAGIENMYVTGYTDESHAWNLVQLDGRWYHLDTTWDDPVYATAYLEKFPELYSTVSYAYFLLSDDSMMQDHTIDAGYPARAKQDYFKDLRRYEGSNMIVPMQGKEHYVVGEQIYQNGAWYVTDPETYAMRKLTNTTSDIVTDGIAAHGMTYANNRIYFLNQFGYLYSYDLNTGSVVQHTKQLVYLKKDAGDLVATSEAGEVYRIPIDPQAVVTRTSLEKQMEKLSKENIMQFDWYAQTFLQSVASYEQPLSEQLESTVGRVKELVAQKERFQNKLATTTSLTKKPQTTTSTKKAWTLTLSSAVANTTANKKAVHLYDQFGNEVEATVTINSKN
ncbi:transglutaminase domain-containing protein [Kurthia senegalensis]|uniref:transglutaminase domain-containing protein n=1 Tax=Kurthia senegalensis TaxID=1033740 RepID=UPI0002895CD2|nr:transglutaminase domain-containing protein [Kurthia senegalensis]